jgi:hypothetical protein
MEPFMTEFTLNMPEWEHPYAVATVRIIPDEGFLSEAVLLGYTPTICGSPERRGITFNTECSKTGDKHAIILLNYNGLDIDTIQHEVRHAYFWVVANQHGICKVNILDEQEEETFFRRLDVLTRRCIATIEHELGVLNWRNEL